MPRTNTKDVVLKDELTADPLTRGYSGMNDKDAAVDLNTLYRTSNRISMTGGEVMQAIDETEFNARTSIQRQEVWDIIHTGAFDPFSTAYDLFVTAFTPGGAASIAAFEALRLDNISRAVELGLGTVEEKHVRWARQ